jgi:hypothetical protein
MSCRAPLAIPLVLAALLLLAVLYGPALVADSIPRGAERVTVTLQKPEAFKDFKATCIGMDERTRGMLADLTQFIRTSAARYLPRGGALEISVTDIDMAGEFESWRGAQACSVRVMLDVYTPRVVLDFRLTDRDGKVVSAGHRDLSDPLYLTRAVTLSTDPLRYEKNLLLDWLRKELSGAGGATK